MADFDDEARTLWASWGMSGCLPTLADTAAALRAAYTQGQRDEREACARMAVAEGFNLSSGLAVAAAIRERGK